ERDFEEGGGEGVEEGGAELVVLLGEGAAEVHAEVEGLGLVPLEGLLDEFVEVAGVDLQDGGEAEVLEGGDAGDGAVPAGLGEQGDVVAAGLVAVGAAEVEDLD